MKILLEIIYNFGALIAFSIISGMVGIREDRKKLTQILQGGMFGIASAVGMLHPFVLSPGLIFDGRSVMISLAGLFFGPLSALIAGSFAMIIRIQQGGAGALTGVLVIISSAVIGSWFYIKRNDKNDTVTVIKLLKLGVIVHVSMLLLMFTLPFSVAVTTINKIGIPVITAYPAATIFIGKILSIFNDKRKLTKELEKQYSLLASSEETFRSIFQNSADAILILKGKKIMDCNQAALDLFSNGIKSELLGKTIIDISPEKQENGENSFEEANRVFELCKINNNFRFIWSHLDKNGKVIPVEIVLTDIELQGNKVFHALIRDISDRKILEKELENMSYHDYLTGLYNRRFFEEELRRLDVERNLPITLVMGDVNGLKLINDSFGHKTGDKLLIKVSDLIKLGCRSDDIISRIGGDEFVILLTQTDGFAAETIVNRIRNMAKLENVESIDISISFGWATKTKKEQDINDILNKAEDYLYKKKLFESPSMRGKTIQTIIQTLHEKNKRQEEHSRRVSCICELMGRALNLHESDVNELKTVGLVHDIGKIAIDESLLNKIGKLTENEWIEMMRHPEIGYRILSMVNEMAEMAEYVLAHHERFDGTGYPKGIKGSEIPLQGRIIAIADAFDAMTSERPYKEKLTSTEAIKELKKNSGTQFDPELVEIFVNKVFKGVNL